MHIAQRPSPGRISIHALLVESDFDGGVTLPPHQYFYPRSPCGERPYHDNYLSLGNFISIHALLVESDAYYAPADSVYHISIHALLVESDSAAW